MPAIKFNEEWTVKAVNLMINEIRKIDKKYTPREFFNNCSDQSLAMKLKIYSQQIMQIGKKNKPFLEAFRKWEDARTNKYIFLSLTNEGPESKKLPLLIFYAKFICGMRDSIQSQDAGPTGRDMYREKVIKLYERVEENEVNS